MKNLNEFFEAIETGDLNAVKACLSPAFTFYSEATGQTWDREAFCGRIEALHAAIPNSEVVLGELATVGETIVANVKLHGVPTAAIDPAVLGPALVAGAPAPLALDDQPWTFNIANELIVSCSASTGYGATFADVLAMVPSASLLA